MWRAHYLRRWRHPYWAFGGTNLVKDDPASVDAHNAAIKEQLGVTVYEGPHRDNTLSSAEGARLFESALWLDRMHHRVLCNVKQSDIESVSGTIVELACGSDAQKQEERDRAIILEEDDDVNEQQMASISRCVTLELAIQILKYKGGGTLLVHPGVHELAREYLRITTPVHIKGLLTGDDGADAPKSCIELHGGLLFSAQLRLTNVTLIGGKRRHLVEGRG